MSISVSWDNQAKTVVRIDFEGKWNWYGYEMAVGEAFGLMESKSDTVDLILNMERSEPLPEGATFYLKRTLELSPRSRDLMVIAHADASTQATVSLFCRIYKLLGNRLVATRTLDKARAFLSEPEAPAPVAKPSVIRLIATQ